MANQEESDDEKLESILRDAMLRGGAAIYAKGDKISVNKGDLTGLKGTVISIEDTTITFQAIGVPSFKKPLEVDV